MKLPNHEAAVVPTEKIVEYLLSAAHEDGRAKAQFFTRFGFGIDDWETLAVAFKRHAGEHDVEKIAASSYGIRYIVVAA